MKPFFAKIAAWWENLPDKDRRTLKLASPVIVVLAIYLLIVQPILGHYQATKAQRAQLSEALVWLYENAALVERMENSCSRLRLISKGDDSLTDFAKNIARRSGATPNVRVINSREMDINFDRVAGPRAIALLQSYVCHGFELSELKMRRDTLDSSEVEFSMRLTAAPLLQESSG